MNNHANANERLASTASAASSAAYAQLPVSVPTRWGPAINTSSNVVNTTRSRTRISYAHGRVERSLGRQTGAKNAAANVATVNVTSLSRSSSSNPKLRPGCIQIGGGFIPPHVLAAASRSKTGFHVGSPPGRRFDLLNLALKYHPEYRVYSR